MYTTKIYGRAYTMGTNSSGWIGYLKVPYKK